MQAVPGGLVSPRLLLLKQHKVPEAVGQKVFDKIEIFCSANQELQLSIALVSNSSSQTQKNGVVGMGECGGGGWGG